MKTTDILLVGFSVTPSASRLYCRASDVRCMITWKGFGRK
jgi:hypothetical protein